MYMHSISERHNERLTSPVVQVRDRMIHWRPGTFNSRISPASGLPPPISVVLVHKNWSEPFPSGQDIRPGCVVSKLLLPAYSIPPAHMPGDVPCLPSWVLCWLFDKECGLNWTINYHT